MYIEVVECGVISASVNNLNVFDDLMWTFGDGTSYPEFNPVTHEYSEPGTYTVCLETTELVCPLICQDVTIIPCDTSCTLDVEYSQEGDSIWFNPMNYPADAVISSWTLDGVEVGDGENFSLDVTDFSPGWHEVCTEYVTEACPAGVLWCDDIYMMPCPDPITITGVQSEDNCGEWTFTAEGFTPGTIAYWHFGDGHASIGMDSIQTHPYGENDTFLIEVIYGHPLCEESYFYEFVVDCPEIDPCELEMEVVWENDSLGLYPFNYPEGVTIEWYLNGEPTAFAFGDSVILDLSEPGEYQICALYEGPCEAVGWCGTWVIEPECEWVDLAVAWTVDNADATVDWELVDDDGNPAGSGWVEIEGDTITHLGMACLVDGCYTFTMSSTYLIGADSFDPELLLIPDVSSEITWTDSTPFSLEAQIVVGESCDGVTSVEESILDQAKVYPVPAAEVLNVVSPIGGLVELQMFNSMGQSVLRETVRHRETISVGHLSAGMYILRLKYGNEVKTFRIPLLK